MAERLDPHTELARTPIFAGLDPEEVRRIAAHASVVRFRKGEFLVRADQPVEALHVLVRGWVKFLRKERSGAAAVNWVFTAPGYPAVAPLLTGLPAPGDFVAMEDAAVLLIPRAEFEALLARSPETSQSVIRFLTRALCETVATGREVFTGRIEERIATLLLWFASRIGVREADGIAIHTPLTRQDIADMLGTTVGTVIRTMRAWKKRGVIDYSRGRIVLADREKLAAIARMTPQARRACLREPESTPRRGAGGA